MDIIKVETWNKKIAANQLRRCGIVSCVAYGGDLAQSFGPSFLFLAEKHVKMLGL